MTARELVGADFAARFAASLATAGLSGDDLSVEVTEQVILQTSNSAIGRWSSFAAWACTSGWTTSAPASHP